MRVDFHNFLSFGEISSSDGRGESGRSQLFREKLRGRNSGELGIRLPFGGCFLIQVRDIQSSRLFQNCKDLEDRT